MKYNHPVLCMILLGCMLIPAGVGAAEGRRRDMVDRGRLVWIEANRRGVVLRGKWLFAPGVLFDLRSVMPAAAVFRPVPVPGIWADTPGLPNEGCGTYLLVVTNVPSGAALGLRLPSMASATRVFANGVEVFSAGAPASRPADIRMSWRSGLVHLPPPDAAGVLRIVIHLANREYYKGGLHLAPVLGAFTELYRTSRIQHAVEWFLTGSLFCIALYHLILFFLRRQDRTPLYFCILCFVVAVRTLTSGDNYIYQIFPGLSFGLLYTLYMLTQAAAVLFFIRYLGGLFPAEVHPLAVRWVTRIFTLIMVFIAAAPLGLLSRSGIVLDVLTLVVALYAVLILGMAIERGREGRLLVSAGVFLFFLTVIHDVLLEYGVLEGLLLIPFGVFLLIFSQAVLLSIRFSRAFWEVERLSQSLERTVRHRTRELQEERDRLSAKNRLLEQEIFLAKQIQKQLIPGISPDRRIAFFYKPMEQVGGDFFDFILYDDGSLGVLLSDVSGHGVPAAFVTSMIKSFILQYGSAFRSPARFLYDLNEFLIGLTSGNFVTAFYGIISPDRRGFVYANAGHNLPYLVRERGVAPLAGGTKGLPLGIMDNDGLRESGKGYEDNETLFASGEKLFLYTDGLVETIPLDCPGQAGFESSYEHLMIVPVLHASRGLDCRGVVDHVHQDLIRFRGGTEFEDDVCMICVDLP